MMNDFFLHSNNQQLGGAAPVVEVHDSLDGAAAPCGDVSLKTRQQRRHHVHSVLLTLSERIKKSALHQLRIRSTF